ncbi:MAG: ROK family protein [Armatimonadetes bacterium]|nr:ROK family protein [Armatimonadota bacterium]
MSTINQAIGVEIGGTTLRIGLVDEKGNVAHAIRLSSSDLYNQNTATERLIVHITEFLWEIQKSFDECNGIGIAAAGYVDNNAKTMVVASNLGWRNFALGREVEDLIGKPVVMDKDTNMAALGEFSVGAGRNLNSLIYVALGTGVGGAIIHEGRLLRGRRNSGGDFGHVFAGGDWKCGCGLVGCLETVAGGVAIARKAREAIEAGSKSIITDLVKNNPSDITAQTVAKASSEGDTLAQQILVEAGNAVGVALVNIIRMVGPEAVILGGSVGKVKEIFETVKAYVEENSAFPGTDLPPVKVLPAALGDSAAIIGAGLVCSKLLLD